MQYTRRLLLRLGVSTGAALLICATDSMAQDLGEDIEIRLDFLSWIKRDTDWLEQAILELEPAASFEIQGSQWLTTGDLATLVAVNRIRAFAHLGGFGLPQPYFLITVETPDGERRRIASPFMDIYAPGLGPFDYDPEKVLPAGNVEPVILDRFTVDPAAAAEYAAEGRTTLADTYLGQNKVLLSEYDHLNGDPDLAAGLIANGWLVIQDGLTGRMRIE